MRCRFATTQFSGVIVVARGQEVSREPAARATRPKTPRSTATNPPGRLLPPEDPVDLPPFYGPGAVRVGSTVTDGSSGRRSAAASARGTIAPYSAGVRYPSEL